MKSTVPLQLAFQGLVQTGVNFVGKRKELAIAVKLDGLLGAVIHRVAVIAISQMSFEGAASVPRPTRRPDTRKSL